MKKFLLILGLLLAGLTVQADFVESSSGVTMENFWEKNGKEQQKILEVGARIINANQLDKRIPINLDKTPKIINAHASLTNKTITISSGILPYIDNDDELAFIMAHETAHSLDSYKGGFEIVMMKLNTREYEYRADLKGIDLMTKAGYNPIAAICVSNKFMPEESWDFFTTHPITSKRLLTMYKHIYKNYPWALKTDMTQNINFKNFSKAAETQIYYFQQNEKNPIKKPENNL